MNDMTTTVERIRSANPVPSPDSLPSGALSTSALLVRIDERSKTMTDTVTKLEQVDRAKPPPRNRGPLVALAVAAAVIVIVGIAALTVLSNDRQPVVTEPPTPTTTTVVTTTTATPTTTQAPQSLLPADTPPLAMVDALAARWNNGDVDGGLALFHPSTDAYLGDDFKAGVGQELWYRWATRMEVTNECEVATPPELVGRTPRIEGAQIVSCVDTIVSGLEPGRVVAGGRWAVEVADGWIYDFFIIDFDGALNELEGLSAYREWMREHIPDRFATLFDPTTPGIIVDTAEAREGHRELVPFFVADTGPRPELALPADTPLLDVVAEFQMRFDAGDIEGYEALIHPAIGYPSGNDAEASWFGAVTGITTERSCIQVDDITVRCEEVATSGLAPGVVVGDFTTEVIGRNGWILAVNFPDGQPESMSDPWSATGVAEYRSWVQETMPDAFDDLFAAGLRMRLDTPELRDRHSAAIADYLAATG